MDIDTRKLKENIIKMSSLVEEALSQVSHKEKIGDNIQAIEDQINHYHTEIDDLCFKYLALIRPVAKDLRTTIAIMKINNELERIGDEVVNIKRFQQYSLHNSFPQLVTMISEVNKMVINSMDSFVHKNIKQAMSVIQNDQVVNDLNRSVIQSFFEGVKSNNFSINDGFNLVLVAKSLERIGDHATNIAEDVIFLISGDDVRHPEALKEKQHTNDSEAKKDISIVNFLSHKKENSDKGN